MPKGPKGQKRPADVIGAAVKVMKIATGEIEEDLERTEYARKGGRKGGRARANKLNPEERSEIARIAPSAAAAGRASADRGISYPQGSDPPRPHQRALSQFEI